MQEVDDMMANYQERKRQLNIAKFQLEHFTGISENDLIEAMCFSHPEGERVDSSELSDKTAKNALSVENRKNQIDDDLYQFYFHQYQELYNRLSFFEYALTQLSNGLADIMTDMVIHKFGWDELSAKYHVSRTTIGKYRKKAVIELEKIYSYRDQQVMRYILS